MKRITGKWFRRGSIVLLVALLLVLPAVTLAQDDEDEDPLVCNPVAQRLADEIGVDCDVLVELQGQGYGLGQIMKAWYMSQNLEGFEGDWLTLLARKQEEGLGWGQFKMAYRLAGEDGDPEALLALKQSGLGWGQIKQAQALDESGLIGFDEVIQMMTDGLGWGDIRLELGLPPGPPPWAGGGKDKTDQGPPAWANNNKGKEAGNDNGNNQGGPPAWANNDKDKGGG